MNKHIIFPVIILLLSATVKLQAQDTTLAARHEQVRIAIGMSEADYAAFRSGTRKYDKQVDSIMRDSSISRELKRVEIGKVLAARRAYMKQHLTEEQLQSLSAIVKQQAEARKGSLHARQKEVMKERLRKRGIKVVTDSTEAKLPVNTGQ